MALWKRILVVLLVGVFVGTSAYVTALWIGYQPTQNVITFIRDNPKTIIERQNYISILGQKNTNNQKVLIFYPGAGITPRAYVKFLYQLRPHYRHIIIAKFPANLAIFDTKAGDSLLHSLQKEFIVDEQYIRNSEIILSGHSLGAAMLSEYYSQSNYKNSIRGAMFLGGYPASNSIKDARLPSLFLYGDNDKILDIKRVQEAAKDWPNAQTEVIEDMNHAQWGDYGDQLGDAPQLVSTESVQAQAIAAIRQWSDVRR